MQAPVSQVVQNEPWVRFWVSFFAVAELILKLTQSIEKEKKEYFFSFFSLIHWVRFKMSSEILKKVTQKVTHAVGWVRFDPADPMSMLATQCIVALRH